jgi:hypothetical protein
MGGGDSRHSCGEGECSDENLKDFEVHICYQDERGLQLRCTFNVFVTAQMNLKRVYILLVRQLKGETSI